MNNAIVITGIGAVSPLGDSTEAFFDRLLAGNSGIARATDFDTADFKSHKCGQVKDFQPEQYITCSKINTTQKVTQYAIAAAKNALTDAGVDLTGDVLAGLVVGTALSGTSFKERLRDSLCADLLLSPRIAVNSVSSEPSGKICMELGIIGHTSILSSLSSSGFNAIQYALLLIRTGRAHRVLVVAAEELSRLAYAAFDEMNLLATASMDREEQSVPFSRHRTGFVLSEGAAAVLLESMASAKQRQAKILSEIRGCCVLNSHREPIADPLSLAITNALQEARLDCSRIDYICANANGSLICDEQEALAIKKCFGRHYERVLISSIKDKIGETLGAAGVFSLVSALMAMQRHELPDNAYLFDEKREFTLNIVSPGNRKNDAIENVLVNSFDGFGNFGALILGRP